MVWLPVVVAVLLLAGCSTDPRAFSDRASSDSTTTPTTAPSNPNPETAPTGQDAAGDLSGFSCTPSSTDTALWTATGTLTNPGGQAAGYRVTVVVVGSGSPTVGTERTVELDAGESAEIEMRRVRGPADGTCQVQVLRTP